PSRPRPTVNMPAMPPVRKATLSAAGSDPDLAAAAVRTLPRTARLIPMKPVRPDIRQPARNASVRKSPDWPKERATAPLVRNTLVEVRNTRIARGTRMMAMVLNWRFRYAMAPSWMSWAISRICAVRRAEQQTPNNKHGEPRRLHGPDDPSANVAGRGRGIRCGIIPESGREN